MIGLVRRALVLTLVLAALTGLAYPLTVTAISQTLFERQADGSLLHREGVTLGSTLVGQGWQPGRYMYGRPSVVGYDSSLSGGSNLGPNSPALVEAIVARAEWIMALEAPHNPGMSIQDIPADLLLSSGSGLDPHVSPEAARFQIPRIATQMGRAPEAIGAIIEEHTGRPVWGIFGKEHVNVLLVNLALTAWERDQQGASGSE